MPVLAAPQRRFEALAHHLETLASETRLELLHALRNPKTLHEIRVTASLARAGENAERPLSRQGVARHLEQLLEARLLRRVPLAGRGRGEGYVINHERLFALVDEMRNLSKLRPLLGGDAPVGATVDRDSGAEPKLPPGPRLVVAYGREDGVGYGLGGPVGSRWRIGRSPRCEIRLDYDPYLSSENSLLERTTEGFIVGDAASRNGTWVNWTRLPRGGTRPLAPGDLITAGRSTLAFQP